jgi:mannose-1-phosphate guanylyltransferase
MLHAIIMAGGSGTRFWPKSRRHRPKQLLTLSGDRSLIQQTFDRIGPLASADRVRIVTGADQVAAIAEQLPEIPAGNLIAEPAPRDTAACVALAAMCVAHDDPDGVMIVMPADHVIRPESAFVRTIEAALQVIDQEPQSLVTFGIRPTRPETGYGYIEHADELGRHGDVPVYRVAQFREKPDRATAEEFLATGRFSWNSGIFVWKAKTILEELARHRPALFEAMKPIRDALGTPRYEEVLKSVFPTLEKVPIDKAVMEKSAHVRMLEVLFDWNDVGDWRALADLESGDDHSNVVQGAVQLADCSDSIVVNEDGRLIAALGLEGVVIVVSNGVTFVARKDKLDSLKAMVESLKSAGHGDLL